jgi:chaperonin GroES
MDFKPTLDRVLVRRAPKETTTSAGFIIPDAATERANKGTVLALGPGKISKDGVLIPIVDITIDSVIMFNQNAGTNVTVNGEELLVLKEEEIIAIVSE